MLRLRNFATVSPKAATRYAPPNSMMLQTVRAAAMHVGL
jgi:hypothetical protein